MMMIIIKNEEPGREERVVTVEDEEVKVVVVVRVALKLTLERTRDDLQVGETVITSMHEVHMDNVLVLAITT